MLILNIFFEILYYDFNISYFISYIFEYNIISIGLYVMLDIIINFISSILFLIFILICVAYFTLLERKILGGIQRRRGPNYFGFFGVLQPLGDAVKLVSKDVVIPNRVNIYLFLFTPIFTFFISVITWSVIPFGIYSGLTDMNYSILFVIAVSSLGAYGVIFSGWSSNSKYSFLGSIRAISQIISYELSFGCIFLVIVYFSSSSRLLDISINQSVTYIGSFLWIFYLLFFITGLAETNRIPFDLPEAEAELVAGYNVEYSSLFFALFFLAEYSNILFFTILSTVCFFGSWMPLFGISYGPLSFSLKVVIQCSIIVWIRGILPRFRYDQLLDLCWKRILPLVLGLFIFYVTIFESNLLFKNNILYFIFSIFFMYILYLLFKNYVYKFNKINIMQSCNKKCIQKIRNFSIFITKKKIISVFSYADPYSSMKDNLEFHESFNKLLVSLFVCISENNKLNNEATDGLGTDFGSNYEGVFCTIMRYRIERVQFYYGECMNILKRLGKKSAENIIVDHILEYATYTRSTDILFNKDSFSTFTYSDFYESNYKVTDDITQADIDSLLKVCKIAYSEFYESNYKTPNNISRVDIGLLLKEIGLHNKLKHVIHGIESYHELHVTHRSMILKIFSILYYRYELNLPPAKYYDVDDVHLQKYVSAFKIPMYIDLGFTYDEGLNAFNYDSNSRDTALISPCMEYYLSPLIEHDLILRRRTLGDNNFNISYIVPSNENVNHMILEYNLYELRMGQYYKENVCALQDLYGLFMEVSALSYYHTSEFRHHYTQDLIVGIIYRHYHSLQYSLYNPEILKYE